MCIPSPAYRTCRTSNLTSLSNNAKPQTKCVNEPRRGAQRHRDRSVRRRARSGETSGATSSRRRQRRPPTRRSRVTSPTPRYYRQAPPPKVLDVLDDELVAQIRRDVLEIGGVLLRGFDVAGPADFERVLLRLGTTCSTTTRRRTCDGTRWVAAASSSRRRSRRTATDRPAPRAVVLAATAGHHRLLLRARRRRAAAARRQSSRRATASPRLTSRRAQLRVPGTAGGRAPGRPRPAAPLRANGACRFFQRRGAQIRLPLDVAAPAAAQPAPPPAGSRCSTPRTRRRRGASPRASHLRYRWSGRAGRRRFASTWRSCRRCPSPSATR